MAVFVDTNVFLRHLLQDHPDHSPRATAYLRRIESGSVRAYVSDTVVFEMVFTLERHYKVPRARIAGALLPLLEMPSILLKGKRRLRRVFQLYVTHRVSFADAWHAVLAERCAGSEIVSFDRGFDRIPGIHRAEP